jgi:hypothetical protein
MSLGIRCRTCGDLPLVPAVRVAGGDSRNWRQGGGRDIAAFTIDLEFDRIPNLL